MKNIKKVVGRRRGTKSALSRVEKLRAAFAALREQAEKNARDQTRTAAFGYPGWADCVIAELAARTDALRRGQLGDCAPMSGTPRCTLRRLLALSPYVRYHRWELDEAALLGEEGARHAAAFDFAHPGSPKNLPHCHALNRGTPSRVLLLPECARYVDFVRAFDQYVLLLAICAKTAECFAAASVFLDVLFRFRDGVRSAAGCLGDADAEKAVADLEGGLRALRVSLAYAQLPDLGEYTHREEK